MRIFFRENTNMRRAADTVFFCWLPSITTIDFHEHSGLIPEQPSLEPKDPCGKEQPATKRSDEPWPHQAAQLHGPILPPSIPLGQHPTGERNTSHAGRIARGKAPHFYPLLPGNAADSIFAAAVWCFGGLRRRSAAGTTSCFYSPNSNAWEAEVLLTHCFAA